MSNRKTVQYAVWTNETTDPGFWSHYDTIVTQLQRGQKVQEDLLTAKLERYESQIKMVTEMIRIHNESCPQVATIHRLAVLNPTAKAEG